MNENDNEAFENWFKDFWSIANIRQDSLRAWEAACEYKQKEIDRWKDAYLEEAKDHQISLNNLQKEIDELKKNLDDADECIDVFYKATKKVGW